MPREDEELVGEKTSHMVEGGLLVVMMKKIALELLDQQTEVIM